MLDIAYYLLGAVFYLFTYGPALLLALFFVLAMWVGFEQAVIDPKKRKQAIVNLVASKCPACGVVFGSEVAPPVKAPSLRVPRGERRPGVRDRVMTVSVWKVECPQCHRESTYYPETGRLYLKPLFLLDGAAVSQLPPERLEQSIFTRKSLKLEYDEWQYAAKFGIQDQRLCVELPEFEKKSESYFLVFEGHLRQLAHHLILTEIEWTIPAPHVVEPQKKPRPYFVRQGFDVLDIPGLGQCFRKVEPTDSETAF